MNPQYHPTNIRGTLGKHILTDGMHIVPDFEKSHGARIVDQNTGKMYIDCYTQFASQPLGWNHKVLKEQKRRMDKVTEVRIANCDLYTPEYAQFVDTFGKILPGFRNHFYIDGGALAVENALKCAFDWKAQKLGLKDSDEVNNFNVIHLKEAFHGRSGYTLSLTNTDPNKIKWFPKFNWTRVLNPKIHNYEDTGMSIEEAEEKSVVEIQQALEDASRPVAAIILEPIQGEGGDNYFRKEYLETLRRLANDYETMLIFDEVQMGFGPTGKWWAHEALGVHPDMVVFGKKAQVCGFACSDKVHEVKDNVFRKSSRINSTWGGNLVDMVRSTILIEAIQKEGILDKVERVGNHFMSLLKKLPLKNLRGKGLIVAFDHYNRDKLFSKLNEKLLCLKCGNHSIRLRPPLTFTENDCEYTYQVIQEAISTI